MIDYATASRTKDHFQTELLKDHPEIVSIAPRLKLNDKGHPTQEAVIVVGIRPLAVFPIGSGAGPQPRIRTIPSKLPAIDVQGRKMKGQLVDVVIENEGEIVPQMNTTKATAMPWGLQRRPFPCNCGNFRRRGQEREHVGIHPQ